MKTQEASEKLLNEIVKNLSEGKSSAFYSDYFKDGSNKYDYSKIIPMSSRSYVASRIYVNVHPKVAKTLLYSLVGFRYNFSLRTPGKLEGFKEGEDYVIEWDSQIGVLCVTPLTLKGVKDAIK